MTFFAKFILFITGYLPLFLILLFLDFKWFSKGILFIDFYHTYLSYFLLVLVFISSFLLYFLFFFIFNKYTSFKHSSKVVTVENSNHEILSYLFAYAIPFLWLDGDQNRLSITFILLFVVFTIFVKSELLKYNFLLLVFNFDIVKISFVDWTECFLIKKHSVDIKKGASLIYWNIKNTNIYLLKNDNDK